MSDLRGQLDRVADKIEAAHREVGADDGASPVLVAVVREFEAKAEKARKAVAGDDAAAREAIVELEQAGDSAKAAAEADHKFMLTGDVFTQDVIDTWIDYKRSREIDAVRLRPHPWEFYLYYDI